MQYVRYVLKILVVVMSTTLFANPSRERITPECFTFESNISDAKKQVDYGITCLGTGDYSEAKKMV